MALVRIVSDIRHRPRSQSPTQLTVIRLSRADWQSQTIRAPRQTWEHVTFGALSFLSISTDMSLYHEVSMLFGYTPDSYKTN